jgi:hypothetical protein
VKSKGRGGRGRSFIRRPGEGPQGGRGSSSRNPPLLALGPADHEATRAANAARPLPAGLPTGPRGILSRPEPTQSGGPPPKLWEVWAGGGQLPLPTAVQETVGRSLARARAAVAGSCPQERHFPRPAPGLPSPGPLLELLISLGK